MNTERAQIGGFDVEIVRKGIKNLHIGCYPPDGRVRVAAPEHVSEEAIRLAVLTRIPWISRKRAGFEGQERQSERKFISGETHYHFGRPLRLELLEWEKKVHRISQQGGHGLLFQVPRRRDDRQMSRWMAAWQKAELRRFVDPRLRLWSSRMGVSPKKWGIRTMKTKWGSCNSSKSIVWLNTELSKKPERAIDYVIVHELAHLISPTHDDRFRSILDREIPDWRTIRSELNRLPLSAWMD